MTSSVYHRDMPRGGWLPQLHRRQRHRREHGADEPEAHDHLRFRPALALEVMMQRGHEEDAAAFAEAFSRVLEIADLYHHRHGLDDEYAADEEEHHFLPDDDRDVADQPTQ